MRQMKSRTEYVRAHCLPEIKRQVRDYKRWRKLVDKWVELGIEYSQIAMKTGAQLSAGKAALPPKKSPRRIK
jgi:hypothetical protein